MHCTVFLKIYWSHAKSMVYLSAHASHPTPGSSVTLYGRTIPGPSVIVQLQISGFYFLNSSSAVKSPSSIFFHTASIRALLSNAVSRFFLDFFDRSADRHLVTSFLMPLHPPNILKMKLRAWHSSSAFMISSQPDGRQVSILNNL